MLVKVAAVLLSESGEYRGEEHALADKGHRGLVLDRRQVRLEVDPHPLPPRGKGERYEAVGVRLRSPDLLL